MKAIHNLFYFQNLSFHVKHDIQWSKSQWRPKKKKQIDYEDYEPVNRTPHLGITAEND